MPESWRRSPRQPSETGNINSIEEMELPTMEVGGKAGNATKFDFAQAYAAGNPFGGFGRKRGLAIKCVGGLIEYVAYPLITIFAALFSTFTWPDWFAFVVVYTGVWIALRYQMSKGRRRLLELCICMVTAAVAVQQFLGYHVIPDVRNKVMVIYPKEHFWPVGLITAGLFSSMKHVLGAIYFGEQHGAAAIRVHFVDRYYTDPAMRKKNYWGYYFDEVRNLSVLIPFTFLDVVFSFL